MKLESSPGFLKNPGSDSGLAFGGVGGGMITTVLRKHTKQYHHKSRFTRHLQFFLMWTISYSHQLYSGLCDLDIGLCEGFRRKLEIGWGEACFLRGT